MKDSYYFQHDHNARNDDKILKIRTRFENEKGVGTYWMLVEIMAESSTGWIDGSAIDELSLSLCLDKTYLSNFIEVSKDIGLFIERDKMISSKRILEYKSFRKERSKSGKQGALERWHSHSSAIAPAMLRKGKERIVKDSKEKETTIAQNKEKTPKSLEDVKAYFLSESSSALEAGSFFDHFESNGWKVSGKTPMQDWKASARGWIKRSGTFNPKRGGMRTLKDMRNTAEEIKEEMKSWSANPILLK